MNILEILNKKRVKLSLRYYGIDDLGTGITVKKLLENKEEILMHFQDNKIETIDEYIDYVFLENIMKFYEVIPFIIKKRRDEFKHFLESLKIQYGNYGKQTIISYIINHYLDIYAYDDKEESHLYLSIDLKDYTTGFIGLNFSSFSKFKLLIDYIINEETFDVIDNFDKWRKYFVENPIELGALFNENNIKKVFYMRYQKIYDILENLKSNKKFSSGISTIIDIIYNILKNNYFNPRGDLAIWQSFYTLNDAIVFFKKMGSPYVYELEKELKQQEIICNKNLVETGYSTTFEFDLKSFADFFKNRTIPWEIRIVYLTHFKDDKGKLSSFLKLGSKSKVKALSDEIARKNPGTDEYFTSWRLRNLMLQTFEIKARIKFIFQNKENISEYVSAVYSELKYICTNVSSTMELEELNVDVEMLSQYLDDLFINLYHKNSSKMTIQNTIYGCSIFICGLIEKVLRILYKSSIKEISYIPDSNITLGTMLKEKNNNTNILIDILGIEEIKCLRYFLHRTESGVGDNIRNDLAHLNGKTIRRLNYDLVTELLAYLSSILNSCVLYYQKQTKNKSNSVEKC